jgi:hypothetical protein
VRKNLKTPKTKLSTKTQTELSTMKYYRFSRRRKKSLYSMYDFYKNRKKIRLYNRQGRSKMKTRYGGALHKAWKGYVIAKNKDEFDKMLHYADIIQECQDDLGLEVSSFHDIGKSALAFYSLRAAQIAEENKSIIKNNR